MVRLCRSVFLSFAHSSFHLICSTLQSGTTCRTAITTSTQAKRPTTDGFTLYSPLPRHGKPQLAHEGDSWRFEDGVHEALERQRGCQVDHEGERDRHRRVSRNEHSDVQHVTDKSGYPQSRLPYCTVPIYPENETSRLSSTAVLHQASSSQQRSSSDGLKQPCGSRTSRKDL